jgi:putative tricarboxylic transport membrane protein
LGERRKKVLFFFSFPFVAIFMLILIKGLDIYLRDPFLKMIGLIS